MTRREIIDALADAVLNPSVKRITINDKPGWLVSWGRMPRPGIMIEDDGLTRETLRQAVSDAGS